MQYWECVRLHIIYVLKYWWYGRRGWGRWVLMKMVRLNMTVCMVNYANCFSIQSFNYIRQNTIFREAYQSIFNGRLFSTLNPYLVNTHFTIYTFNRLALFTRDFQWFWQTLAILLMFQLQNILWKILLQLAIGFCQLILIIFLMVIIQNWIHNDMTISASVRFALPLFNCIVVITHRNRQHILEL